MEDNFKAPEWKRIDLGEINNDEAVKIINERHKNKFAALTDDFWHNYYIPMSSPKKSDYKDNQIIKSKVATNFRR